MFSDVKLGLGGWKLVQKVERLGPMVNEGSLKAILKTNNWE